MCEPCKDIAHKSVDERYLYLFLYGQGSQPCSLARSRLAWLALQTARGKRYARPMPEDPEPSFWPAAQRKQITKGTQGTVARLKAALRVEDIAGRLTTLRGNSVLSGKCPLHGERNGQSFVVWIDSQSWRCFGRCGVGGDVLNLIAECMDRDIEWREKGGELS